MPRQQKRFKEAIADLEAAIKSSPSSPWCYELRGAMHVLDGDADRGIADFEKMLQLDAADPAAHYEATSRAPLGGGACSTAGNSFNGCSRTGRPWPSTAKRPQHFATGRPGSSPAKT